jgi:hypothetical protein
MRLCGIRDRGNTHLSTGTSKNPWICDACRSIVCSIHIRTRASSYGIKTYDKMVASGALQHVCHKLCGNGCATLVLFVLARVGKEGNDSGDPLSAGNLARVNHDAEFHERGIDRVAAGLDDVDIIFADRFEDSDSRFTNRVACNPRFRDRKTDPGRWHATRGMRGEV